MPIIETLEQGRAQPKHPKPEYQEVGPLVRALTKTKTALDNSERAMINAIPADVDTPAAAQARQSAYIGQMNDRADREEGRRTADFLEQQAATPGMKLRSAQMLAAAHRLRALNSEIPGDRLRQQVIDRQNQPQSNLSVIGNTANALRGLGMVPDVASAVTRQLFAPVFSHPQMQQIILDTQNRAAQQYGPEPVAAIQTMAQAVTPQAPPPPPTPEQQRQAATTHVLLGAMVPRAQTDTSTQDLQ